LLALALALALATLAAAGIDVVGEAPQVGFIRVYAKK
jgi:hypothetical protein